ncbi:hypothetical protein [Bradyrhizobium acaciae]|uniref:hypothetical protein n=1 Tax=Bradyrhizobium acaciae TaxID=2683706 RepID=UPI001E5BD7A9|nr:hypothetical protein [Bradyrhizobium acaciae]MCC8978534.1 hypothetical protein [Bradyrhizobium acaciae]
MLSQNGGNDLQRRKPALSFDLLLIEQQQNIGGDLAACAMAGMAKLLLDVEGARRSLSCIPASSSE